MERGEKRLWGLAALLVMALCLGGLTWLWDSEGKQAGEADLLPPAAHKPAEGRGSPAQLGQKVRVGAVEQPGYMMPTGYGTMRGFDAEYVYQIGGVAGFQVEFVTYPDYGEMLAALERGEVDMGVGVGKTPEREGRFLFSEQPFAKGELALRVRDDDERYAYGKLDEMQYMHVGVLKSSSMGYWTHIWTQKQGMPEATEYRDLQELEEALERGEVDGIVVGDFLNFKNTRVLSQFTAESYHPVFNLQGMELKAEVDGAMHRINSFDPLFEMRLRRKYKDQPTHHNTAFTPAEKRYMVSHPQVTVAVVDADPPYFYKDSKTGEARGVAPEFFRKVTSVTGMGFDFRPYGSYYKALEAVQQGEADMLGLVHMDSVTAAGSGMIITTSYYTQNLVEIMRDGYTEWQAKVVAVADSDLATVRQLMASRGVPEDTEYRSYRTSQEAYNAFNSGEAEALICGMDTASWLLNHNAYVNYAIVDLYAQGWSLSSAMLPQDGLLSSILSKAAVSDGIDMQNVMMRMATTQPGGVVYWRRLPLGAQIMVFLLVILLVAYLLGMMFYSHMQRVKAKAAVAEADLLAMEKAKKAESAFMANMSHDMRTPLNGIIGFTELALAESDEEKRGEYLEKISFSANLMRDLVNDVLDLSKIEGGMLDLLERPTNLSDHFTHIMSAVQTQVEKKKLDFRATEVLPRNVWVMGDALRMEQIALNLLSNAIKYTPEGGRVEWHSEFIDQDELPPNTCRLRSIIKDNGIGMSEEFQQHMFEPFRQEHQKGTERITGTGLGLSIVKRIIDLMGGALEVESKLGEGTTFTIIYNLSLTEPPVETLPAEEPEGGNLAGLRVLLCEDNEINAELAGLLLAGSGAMKVDWAKNGQEGLEMFRSHPENTYDVILMDLRMPVMDGLTATKEIRALGLERRTDAASIPIVAMSADAYEEDVERCMAAGMNAHLAKPIDIKEVERTLMKYCRK